MARAAVFKPRASAGGGDIFHCFQNDGTKIEALPTFAAKTELARS
jgi:hypothetical protein